MASPNRKPRSSTGTRAAASSRIAPSRLQRLAIATGSIAAAAPGATDGRAKSPGATLPAPMCGFISIFGPPGSDVLQDVLTGLLAIQHRGQDAAGIVSFADKFQAKKGLGLVREVFQEKHLHRLR